MTDELEDWQQEQLIERVRNGSVFIYPTDTCYGIGCSIFSSEAIDRVFQLKGRDDDKPVPVLTHPSDVDELADVSDVERQAMDTFWPGALTLVMTARNPNKLDNRVLRSGTIALRTPDVPPLVSFLEETGPIVGTSANLSGKPSPSRLSDVHPELLQDVDFVLGETEGEGESSTVAEWKADDNKWIIHREGPVTRDELDKLVP